MMKHLLSGVALAALLTAGIPAMAQTGSDSTKQPAAARSGTAATGVESSTAADTNSARSGASTSPQSGATTPSNAMDKSSKSAKSGGKHEASASDNMAEQLNKQELQRVENGGQAASGSSQPPTPTTAPSAGSTSGAH